MVSGVPVEWPLARRSRACRWPQSARVQSDPQGGHRMLLDQPCPRSTPPPLWVCSVVASPHANWDLVSWASSLSLGTISRDGSSLGEVGGVGAIVPYSPGHTCHHLPPLGETLTQGGGSYKRVYLRDLGEPGEAVPLASRVSVGSSGGHRAPFSFTAGTRLWCPRRNSPYWLRTGSE